MKFLRILFICCIIFACIITSTQIVQAKSLSTIKIDIIRNPITRHFYFVPTYPHCLTGSTNIEIINTTESSPVIQKENYQRFVSLPFSEFVALEITQKNSHWILLEPEYLGGNAYLYFIACNYSHFFPPFQHNNQSY